MIQFLSYSLDEATPTYGNGLKFKRHMDKCIEHGASCNQFTFTVGNHVGTHLDCPKHFDQNGMSVTEYDANFWECYNISLVNIPESDLQIDLEKYKAQIDPKSEMVLLKTGFCYLREDERYWQANPGVIAASADFLRNHCPKLRFLGMDFISLTSYLNRDEGKKSHQAFLQNQEKSILLIEDMDLRNLSDAPTKVLVSLLRMIEADGGSVIVFVWSSKKELS
jgi:arylformamidase